MAAEKLMNKFDEAHFVNSDFMQYTNVKQQ